MTTTFLSQDIWPQLTKAVRASSHRCAAAVAYFGAGAEGLLPLRKGSRLVVDASERAVASGQTCPTDLLKLLNNEVAVYSVPNLHAKVFVLGSVAYIGSANVSSRSASHLVEAVIRTTEPKTVHAAREFVKNHCLRPLTPELLKRLARLYRPPQVAGGIRDKGRVTESSRRPMLPRLLLAQLKLEDWSEGDQHLHDEAQAVAMRRRQHPRSYELDSFRWPGSCPYQRGDVVIQVLDEGHRSILVSPPGNVLHVRSRGANSRKVSFVYLELPAGRRRQVKSMARTLDCSQKRLLQNGLVRDKALAQALLNTFAVTR